MYTNFKFIFLNIYLNTDITFLSISERHQYKYCFFPSFIFSDTELLKWLLALNIEGIAIVEGIGTDETQLEKLTKRIGFTKMTTYG